MKNDDLATTFGLNQDRIWTEKSQNMVGNVYCDTKYVPNRSHKRPFTMNCTFRSLLRPKMSIMFTRGSTMSALTSVRMVHAFIARYLTDDHLRTAYESVTRILQ